MISKEIKAAILDTLKARASSNNFGMLSSYRINPATTMIMARNRIRIEGDNITMNRETIATIERNWSSRKVGGCYLELTPKVNYINN